MGEQQYRWSQQSLAELEELYWDEIAPAMRRAGLSPSEERPSYEWLAENGFSGLAYALREHHDLTLTEFFVDVVGLPDGSADTNPWGEATEKTEQALESHLETLRTRRGSEGTGLAEATVRTHRSRLAKFVRTYHDLYDPGIVERAGDPSVKAEEYDRVLAVFDTFRSEFETAETVQKYFSAVRDWYDTLDRRHLAEHDPSRAAEEWSLERSEPDNLALDAQQVRAIYEAARARENDLESELLVLATCGWGLRRNEVARLHVRQLVLNDGDPRIVFEERKNGPSTVALIYGLDALDERMYRLADQDEWGGYLFPSKKSSTGHIHANTVTDRFRTLADEAGVRIQGEPPTPQYGRRFWYDTFKDAVSELIELANEVAEEQGSKDPRTVYENYWSEEERRQLRRDAMQRKLERAFEMNARTNDGA